MSDSNWLNVVYIIIISTGFFYGVLSILRDLKKYGTFETILYWYREFFKEGDNDDGKV